MKKEEAKYIIEGTKIKVKSVNYNRFQIIDNHGQQKYVEAGDILTVKRKLESGKGYRFYFKETAPHNQSYYLTLSQVELINDSSTPEKINQTMKSIGEEIERLYKEQGILKQKLLFIEETGCKRVDEVEFRSWMVLNALENNPNMDKKEKTKLVSELIKTSK